MLAFVSVGGGLGWGAAAGIFAGAGDGNEINGDGAGPCARATATMATIATKLEINFCIAGEFVVRSRD